MKLDQVIPWGRTRREYELMFNLSERDRSRRFLGCGDGPASFNAEMTAAGYSVISVDPVYEFSGEQIRQRFNASGQTVIDQVKATPERWVWTFHKDADDLLQTRTAALEGFLADYERGKIAGRYRIASLPELPFRDRDFEIALCSHFLFLYSDFFDTEFHITAVREMFRIATDVRIFPILTLAQNVSPHVEPVRAALRADGIESSIETVNYGLQRGGNQMLRFFLHE